MLRGVWRWLATGLLGATLAFGTFAWTPNSVPLVTLDPGSPGGGGGK